MPKHRKIDFSTWSIDGYGNDLPPLGGYVCLIGALQMWCKIILAALLEIRELYRMKWRIAIYGPNSKHMNIAGSHPARGPDFVSRLYSCPQPTTKVWAPRASDLVRSSRRKLYGSFLDQIIGQVLAPKLWWLVEDMSTSDYQSLGI